MTPQEKDLLTTLLARLKSTVGQPTESEDAEGAIRLSCKPAPATTLPFRGRLMSNSQGRRAHGGSIAG